MLELTRIEGSSGRSQLSRNIAAVPEQLERLELRVTAIEDSERQLSSDMSRQIKEFRKQLVYSLARLQIFCSIKQLQQDMQFKFFEDVADLISDHGEATVNIEKGVKRLELQAKCSKSKSCRKAH